MQVFRKFFDALNKKIYAFFMQHTKLSGNCFRINVQHPFFLKVKRHFAGSKNCSMKHTKNQDSLNIHAYRIFPTRQDVQSSTLSFSSVKDKK